MEGDCHVKKKMKENNNNKSIQKMPLITFSKTYSSSNNLLFEIAVVECFSVYTCNLVNAF